MTIFEIKSDSIELFKLLKATGVFESGGSAKTAIVQGLVKVNHAVETRKAKKIIPGQVVTVGNISIEVRKFSSETC